MTLNKKNTTFNRKWPGLIKNPHNKYQTESQVKVVK